MKSRPDMARLAYTPEPAPWLDSEKWTFRDVLRLVAFGVGVVVVALVMYAIAFLAAVL